MVDARGERSGGRHDVVHTPPTIAVRRRPEAFKRCHCIDLAEAPEPNLFRRKKSDRVVGDERVVRSGDDHDAGVIFCVSCPLCGACACVCVHVYMCALFRKLIRSGQYSVAPT